MPCGPGTPRITAEHGRTGEHTAPTIQQPAGRAAAHYRRTIHTGTHAAPSTQPTQKQPNHIPAAGQAATPADTTPQAAPPQQAKQTQPTPHTGQAATPADTATQAAPTPQAKQAHSSRAAAPAAAALTARIPRHKPPPRRR